MAILLCGTQQKQSIAKSLAILWVVFGLSACGGGGDTSSSASSRVSSSVMSVVSSSPIASSVISSSLPVSSSLSSSRVSSSLISSSSRLASSSSRMSSSLRVSSSLTVSSSSSASSVGNVVQIFQHCNYQGWSISLPLGDFDTADIISAGGLDNDASSIKIVSGYEAHLYRHNEQVGVSVMVTQDTACLTAMSFNDVLSSLSVKTLSAPEGNPEAAACFYEQNNFSGGSVCVNPGSYDLPSAWSDTISSLTLAAGFQIELFENTQWQGQSVLLMGNAANLESNGFNNLTSSYRITRTQTGCADNESCDLTPDVTAISVVNKTGGAPQKGDVARINLTLNNSNTKAGWVKVTPYLTSQRFSDYSDVELTSTWVKLSAAGNTQVGIDLEPFISDLNTKKQYAVGHGNYQINRVEIVNANGSAMNDSDYSGKSFSVAKTSAVLPIVVYDVDYFLGMNYVKTPATYIKEVFTRTGQLYNPDTDSYQHFSGGFDEMMNVRHVSQPVPGFVASSTAGGYCEQATAYVEKTIGITAGTWGGGVKTSLNHHGFDYAIALTPDMGGGVACGWINVQVSSYIGTDLDRLQIVAVHESGHIFGSPHCDPLQGYVMCSGEKHERYEQQGIFVWHKQSRDAMSNRYD